MVVETEDSPNTHEPQPSDAAAITQPIMAFDAAPIYTPPPRRTHPRHRILWLALALLTLLLVGGSSALAALGAIPSPFLASQINAATATATNTLSPTNTSTATAANTSTPTRIPTATSGGNGGTGGGPNATAAPGGGGPTTVNGVSLGCPSGSLHPYNGVINAGSAANEVALTFDDGPSPDYTSTILSTLESTHTVATFFVLGVHVGQYPGFIKRVAADGFGIGIHTWDHPPMSTLSAASREWEIGSTANAIHQVLGPNYCLPYWRPPYGDYNSAVVSQMVGYGLTSINWNDDPTDWSAPGVSTIVNRVLGQVHGGSIILMHDGPIFRWQTAQALPQILAGLKARHLTPVTIPQLLGLPQPHATPGATPTPSPASTVTPTPPPAATNTPTPAPTDTPTSVPTDTPSALLPSRANVL